MRSLEEILRSYNIVNSRAASRYTIRFTAMVALAGVFVLAAAMLLSGGPEAARLPTGNGPAASQGDGGGEGADAATDPFELTTLEGDDWSYIGYPLAQYDPAHADQYDRGALEAALAEWLAAQPTTGTLAAPEPVHDPQGDSTLMGYIVRPLEPGLD